MATSYSIGPCGCCGTYECECADIPVTEVKVTLSGFTGVCAAWNGDYFLPTPLGHIVFGSAGGLNFVILHECDDLLGSWSLAVQVSAALFCFFSYSVLIEAQDPRISCSGGSLTTADLTGSDTTTCQGCGAGSVSVLFYTV